MTVPEPIVPEPEPIPEVTQEAIDEVRGALVALMRAQIAGDAVGFEMLAESIEDLRPLVCEAIGLAVQFGTLCCGRDEMIATLERWTPGSRFGDL